MTDFLVRGSLAKLDPDVFELTQLEAERQAGLGLVVPDVLASDLCLCATPGLHRPSSDGILN